MSRKPNNFRRGGGSSVNRRFGGTRSLGNYNRSGNRKDGHAENRRSGSWGGGNIYWSYKESSNNNNNFGFISNSKLNNQEDGFQKFRDPNALEQHNSNMRSHHDSQERNGRGCGRERRGGKPKFGGETHKNDVNWYEERRNAQLLQADEQNQDYLPSSALQVSTTSNLPQTIPLVAPPPTLSTTLKNLSHDEVSKECNLENKKDVLKYIKQEKTEVEKDNRILKQTHKPASSSSSSSESSESEDEELPSKASQNIVKNNTIKVKQEALGKQPQKINTEQSTSDSSSEDRKRSDKTSTKSNMIMEKGPKIAKKQSKKKHSSEEDLICLGKLERNFVIEDDVSEETEVSSKNRSGMTNNQCLICDKPGHSAFECQMICKNCSAPYHSMKSCPKPANLSTMLQSYMEFCIGQMSQFNPEKKFTMPPNICVSESSLAQIKSQLTTVQNKKVKRLQTKSENSLKKATKRRHRYASKSSDDEKDDVENKTGTETSESESESDSSEKLTATKVKKRRTKMPSPMKTPKFHNTFVPPFSSFPAFGAAAAAYNPLLLSQLMNSGGFGAADKLIFQ
nr:protein mushroom body miniature isoform X1 [Bactrocera oleae]XP_036218988.1 protein mushroom body miniature isoform X1 [Bactrocera oleae]XP_036218994.1 protein mushroom body miniature isoform X1 [Bactrocera oleae]XP_036218998.1 protein mushroom body miniature isoform X1 [Bactrocera oleae]XP_036219005.1 protein mushroom body miniature isoform X1 [Bactrocera oleae]